MSVAFRLVPVTLAFTMMTTGVAIPFAAASADLAPVTIKTEVLSSKIPAGADVSSLLQKFRDFSHFATGDLAKDTAYALNIVSWQMPHGGFYKDMEEQYTAPWDGVTARSAGKTRTALNLAPSIMMRQHPRSDSWLTCMRKQVIWPLRIVSVKRWTLS